MSRKAEVDQKLAQDLVQLGRELPFNVVSGKTVCTNDFYEGRNDINSSILIIKYIHIIRYIEVPVIFFITYSRASEARRSIL